MAYATLAQLKEYLGVGSTDDDALLGRLLDAATAAIDQYCNRTFTATSGERKYYEAMGKFLWLDGDLLSVSGITNGDGNAVTTYALLPANATPKFAIVLAAGSWVASATEPITVTGQWGYSTAPPADIVHACIRLAAYYYRQKDAQVYDTVAEPSLGIITVPAGLPADVARLLDPYRRFAYGNA